MKSVFKLIYTPKTFYLSDGLDLDAWRDIIRVTSGDTAYIQFEESEFGRTNAHFFLDVGREDWYLTADTNEHLLAMVMERLLQ